MELKKFDLEKAKAGAKVVTRDGREARIICFDRQGGEFMIVALVKDPVTGTEDYASFKKDGRFNDGISVRDLFMAPVKKKGWINIYPNSIEATIYKTKEDASLGVTATRIDCIEIEYNAE